MSGRWEGPLKLEFPEVGGTMSVALEDFWWMVDALDPDSSERVQISAGTVSRDGASKPWFSKWLVGGRYRRPRSAMMHDMGYNYPKQRELYKQGHDRAWWDEQYRRGLIAEGSSHFTARVEWLGVRLGGRFHPNW